MIYRLKKFSLSREQVDIVFDDGPIISFSEGFHTAMFHSAIPLRRDFILKPLSNITIFYSIDDGIGVYEFFHQFKQTVTIVPFNRMGRFGLTSDFPIWEDGHQADLTDGRIITIKQFIP